MKRRSGDITMSQKINLNLCQVDPLKMQSSSFEKCIEREKKLIYDFTDIEKVLCG